MKSAFERQSVVVSAEVLIAGLVNRDTRTSKAIETQIYDPRIIMSRCDDLVARRYVPGELSLLTGPSRFHIYITTFETTAGSRGFY